MEQKNVHEGHRQRMKKRFLEQGLEGFTDIEALELLLYYAIPRRDTNVLAHDLLNRFGGFRGVMEASADEISLLPGLGQTAAELITLMRELDRRYITASRPSGKDILRDPDAAGEYLKPLYSYATEEMVFCISLSSAGKVKSCRQMGAGMANRVEFSVREVVELALADKAPYILLSHNHLSDTALPSKSDVETSRTLYNTLAAIGVQLTDHIIVSGDDYVSMRESGFFADF